MQQLHFVSTYLNIVFNLRYSDFVHQMENSGQKSVLEYYLWIMCNAAEAY